MFNSFSNNGSLCNTCLALQDVFIECEDTYGPIEEMNVCDNLGDHLVGNVYIKVHVHIVYYYTYCT